jgi:hypothetical protein
VESAGWRYGRMVMVTAISIRRLSREPRGLLDPHDAVDGAGMCLLILDSSPGAKGGRGV